MTDRQSDGIERIDPDAPLAAPLREELDAVVEAYLDEHAVGAGAARSVVLSAVVGVLGSWFALVEPQDQLSVLSAIIAALEAADRDG